MKMSIPKAIQSVELGDGIGPNDLSGAPGLSECHKTLVEPEEEEEEEDIDFNPFLKESPSEASSSLSSEVEGWDANVDSDGENSPHMASGLSSMQSAVTKTSPASSSGHCKRMILHSENSNEAQGREIEEITIKNKRSKVVTISNPENIDIGVKETGSGSGTDVVTDALDADVDTSKKCINDIDEEDAICRRTRARYSLASFSLDELETFLQGTDDEDDFQNVDEEEEYRKFLSAVLQGGDGADPATLDNGNDEDEDNDADFEIEIEEALESDPEDCLMVSKQKDKGAGRCPETRRNKHQKDPLQSENSPGQPKRTLRPLLPILPNVPIVSCPGINNRYMMPNATRFLPSRHDSVTNGFTPHQIGQLYYLIHEHVQLLIQVYSLCVLEPSRQHIASQVQGFIEDMIEKRNQVLNQRNVHYPSFCFGQPYAHQSTSDDGIAESSQTTDDHRVLSSTTDRLQGPPPCGKRSEHASMGCVNSVQASQGCGMLPSIGSAVLSVLDVAPLKLVGRYIDDVSTAVREHQRRYVEAANSINLIKEPLFPLPAPPSTSQVHNDAREESNLVQSNVVPSSSPNQKPPKKSLAATLVENTKKQSVALVPKEIAKLAQQFYPFFNPTLFPHKPPPSSVAKRVLFTDAEDELLALGMMEYNNDWKAIQQRFLPCKSKHQIFVRAKNRCSAKAPENPIKAVRRMKTSPLNPDEIARIHEGLKVFKLDWMSIWKFIVPYRDLSLLPRQWRIALGTQKSYKMDSAKKESRRIYESKRRRKIAASGRLQVASKETEIVEENDSREECLDNENGAYVHEAFLADWRPASSCPIDSENCSSILGSRCLLGENSGNQTNQESQPERGSRHKFPYASGVCREPDSHPEPYGSSESSHGVPNCPTSLSTLKPSKYRARRTKSPHLVRLAPDLPPVNLPPSVRVISHVAFRSSQNGGSTVSAPARFSTSGNGMGTAVSGPSPSPRPSLCASKNISNTNISLLCSQDSGSQKNICVPEENGTTDLQMHPLLFQTPNHRSLPYCPVISSNSPISFSFFPATSHQINISPFGNPGTGDLSIDGFYNQFQPKEDVSPSGLDFHPLLRRTDDFNSKIAAAGSTAQVSADLAVRDADGEAQTLARATGQINAQSAASAGTTSPKSNTNDLNLEFNLSSVPLEEKISSNNQTEVFVLSNNFGGCATIGDSNHSMPEIVMEQEELSDSDDEIEDVEFECEEMADSEGDEGSDCEHNAIEQNELKQEKPNHTVGASQFVIESTACEDPEGIPAQSKDASSRTLDLCGPEKDSATSPWLSLSSHAL